MRANCICNIAWREVRTVFFSHSSISMPELLVEPASQLIDVGRRPARHLRAVGEADGSGCASQQASSGVFILMPGSTMPPRFPISVPPYRSAKAGGNGRPFGGQSQRRSRCRLRSGSGQSS